MPFFKNTLLLGALLPILLIAIPVGLQGQIPVNKRPEIVRKHDPMIHYVKLAEANGWEIQSISSGAGEGVYHHVSNQFLLIGDFTEDDNPISAYFDFLIDELTKQGVAVGGGSTLYDESEGLFQKRLSYKLGETIGVVRVTAVLDFKNRFLVDIFIVEFPEGE